MNVERKIELFGVLAVFMFGSVFGGFMVYQHMDERLTQLEEDFESEAVSTVQNDSMGLADLFDDVERSVVSVRSAGEAEGEGSGFVYSDEGYIVTNYHVIDSLESVEVVFTDGEVLNAEVVGSDIYSDLAVLKVDRDGLEALELEDTDDVRIGDTVIAVGNPFGLQGTMTSGIVSQKERLIATGTDFSIPDVIQTDAAINPGNSGGPLMNTRGEVIGVNTAIETGIGTFSGIGLAVSSNTVDQIVPELIREGDYQHSWLGVAGQTVNHDIAEEMGLDDTEGFMVAEVVEGGPADEAGLRAGDEVMEFQGHEVNIGGDVIVAINGEKVRDITEVLLYLQRNTEAGETVEVTILRDGEQKDVAVTLQDRPSPGR